MPGSHDRLYEEALALWRAVSDEPPPPGDAKALMEAAIARSGLAGYERFKSRWLNDPALSWAIYRDRPQGFA